MSQTEKAAYFKALKEAGVEFSKHYREYTTETLRVNYDRLVAAGVITPKLEGVTLEPGETISETLEPYEPETSQQEPDPATILANLSAAREQLLHDEGPQQAQPEVRHADPAELAGQRLNSQNDEPIRIDPETGYVWYQEEVRKPAYPKPRGRRVLRYKDRGVKKVTVGGEGEGRFTETFEIPGDGPEQNVEVKITLPSYQVGKYRDPRFPFMVYVYNERRGFDYYEVIDFYGAPELVPASIKKVYVENVLCWDMRTTIMTIEAEHRALQLSGKIVD